MNRRAPGRPEAEHLADRDAARLLARASELDAAGVGATVTELRAAAAEAGISDRAFDAALAEMHRDAYSQALVPASPPRWRRRLRTVAAAAALLVGIATLAVSRRAVEPNVGPAGTRPMIEESFVLRCLSGREAVVLVRPLLHIQGNTILHSPDGTSRLLRVRATAEQLREVRALLERHEASGAPACATVTVPAASRDAPGPAAAPRSP